MTVEDLEDMISEQLGHRVSSLRSLEGRDSGTSSDFFNKDECSYTGLATTLERHLDVRWTFKKFDDGWYFSSDAA